MEIPVNVDTEFIEEGKKINYKIHTKNGGPYSKSERDKRRQEIYKLHFEYGYSARNISELMKINRNTINGDIDYWYSKMLKNTNMFNPEGVIILNVQRLEIQRTRLREQLDKTKSFQEKMALERLIYEIDCKILYIYNKAADSVRRISDLSIERLNQWMKENNKDNRYMTLFDKLSVSKKAYDRIEKIIREDRIHPSS